MDVAVELAAAAEFIDGKPWGADKGKPRIYMKMPTKEASVFFDYPDASADKDWGQSSCLGKPVFKCFIEAPDKPGEWYREEKEKIRSQFRPQHLALIARQHGLEKAAPEMLTLTSLDENEFNRIATLLDEGKQDEAIDAVKSIEVF